MKLLKTIIIITLILNVLPRVTARSNPFCANEDATREYFHKLCDYIVNEKSNEKVIVVGGYYMRSLVAGYKIFGEKHYLDLAIAYADTLLKKQSARGYWQTGYRGRLYLADSGSALGLFIVLHKYVDKERQKKYFNAVKRYVDAIERDGLIRSSGALDVGLKSDSNGIPSVPYDEDYTTSSQLTGGEVFTWMYHLTKQEKYRQIAYNAQKWVLSTMREDGVIPYNCPFNGSDLRKQGDRKNDSLLWENSLYLTSAYQGEGTISFDLHCEKKEWKKEFRQKIKPHIDYVLKTQNLDGTWSKPGWWDQKRSSGIINFLIWYYKHVEKDPRIPAATKKFEAFILVPENAKAYGMLNEDPQVPDDKIIHCDVGTSLTCRALADMIKPGIDSEW